MIRDYQINPYSSIKFSTGYIEGVVDFFEKILSSGIEIKPVLPDKPVILYGASSLGKMAEEWFAYNNIPFLYFVDKNAPALELGKRGVTDKRIFRPNDHEITDDKHNALILICCVTSPQIALMEELRISNWKHIAFFYDMVNSCGFQHPLNNGWFLERQERNEIKKIRQIIGALADDSSRLAYIQLLVWHHSRIELDIEGMRLNLNDRFFIPEIRNILGDEEVFVDCGSYSGDVLKKFFNITNGKFKNVYAIEPDKTNIEKFKFNNIPYAIVLNYAVSSYVGEGKFYGGFGFASRIDQSGNDMVKVTTIDILGIPATFIKMHLEGGEMDALIGSIKTIQRHRPILAVTIYHNSDAALKLPAYLINNLEDYVYLVRLHSYGGTGAVLYAIPKERLKRGIDYGKQ